MMSRAGKMDGSWVGGDGAAGDGRMCWEPAAAAGQGVEQLVGTPDALIQMRRGGCPPDQCPVYGVSVFMDGTVRV